MNEQSTCDRLVGVLREYLPRVKEDENVDPSAQLADLGLDSMNAINLMLDIEGEFEVDFPDSMLTPEVFHSVATLEQAILQLIQER